MKIFKPLTSIYAIVHPNTSAIFYVGRAKEMRRRMCQHLGVSDTSWHPNIVLDYAIISLRLQKKEPLFFILEEVPDEHAEERETYWIQREKLRSPLCNLTHRIPGSEYAYESIEHCRRELPAMLKELYPHGKRKEITPRKQSRSKYITKAERWAIYNEQCKEWAYGRGPDPGDFKY